MSANRLRMICNKIFSKKIYFGEQLAYFRFLTLFRALKKFKKFSKPNFNFFQCSLYVPAPFLKIKKFEKITNKLCGIFQKYKTLGGPLNMVFWGKKKKKFFVLQRPQGSICGLTIFFIPKFFFIDTPYCILYTVHTAPLYCILYTVHTAPLYCILYTLPPYIVYCILYTPLPYIVYCILVRCTFRRLVKNLFQQ